MSSWLRGKDHKKLNSIETIHEFIGFMHSGSDDYSRLTKLLSKNIMITINTPQFRSIVKYKSHNEYTNYLESCYKGLMDFTNGFNLNETTIKYENSTYIISTKGTIRLHDKKFNLYKIAELDETFTITTDAENLINSIDTTLKTQFIQFIF